MNARVDNSLIKKLAKSFPNHGWKELKLPDYRNWKPAWKDIDKRGGVYVFLLPAKWFQNRILHLHAPGGKKGNRTIKFEFSVPSRTRDGYGIVYVGKSANLRKRLSDQLGSGERRNGKNQVKCGLLDCEVAHEWADARDELRKFAKIKYVVLNGEEHCANRDVLEMSLCGRFAPAFNIKAEH